MFSNFTLNFQTNSRNDHQKLFSKSWKEAFDSCQIPDSFDSFYWKPEFLNEVQEYETEYYYEWRTYLLRKNREEINKAKNIQERFTFYSPNIVRSIFNICSLLRQPPEVRYLAVDILDRFLVYHFFDVSETFEKIKDETSVTWEEVTERMLDQALLRILSSIQLAIKFCCSYNLMTVKTVQEVMDYLKHEFHYSKKSIIKSEIRVFQSLQSNIHGKTPLTYIEMFFEELHKENFFRIQIPLYNFLRTCICVLDVAIVHHKQIYLELIKSMESNYETPSDSCICTVALKADFLILAASAIYAAGVLEDSDMVTSNIILESLCSVGECEKSDVQFLAKQILCAILRQ